jgi:N-methylhydantoinase B
MRKAGVDLVTVEVIRSYLVSAAQEMKKTMQRTSYNTIIYEILDFAISLYNRNLELVAEAPGLAIFLGANDYAARKAVEKAGENNLNEGDILIMNYPYWSSAHTYDVPLVAPIFLEGEIIAYSTIRAHWLDLGAKDSGYLLDSTELFQEGLILPSVKIVKEGRIDEEIFDIIRFNSRFPDRVIGDLNAQIAAIRVGERRIKELAVKYGKETLSNAMVEIIHHGERMTREVLKQLPSGSWSAVDYMDDDGIEKEKLVKLKATVTIDNDGITIDFTGSADQVRGPFNVPLGMTQSIAKIVFKCITTPHLPANEGNFKPLKVIAPEGSIFNPIPPAPTFTLWTAILAIEVVTKALAPALPKKIPASSGGDLCDIMMVGKDPETHELWLEAANEGVGWGASYCSDGINATMHISETQTRNLPVEVLETKAPVMIERLELLQDSGGAGEFRGGLGLKRDYRFLAETDAIAIVKKTKTNPWGLEGGRDGTPNYVLAHLNTDKERRTGAERFELKPGETISNRSGGGGGYGDPLKRDPKLVSEDVLNEYISLERAKNVYGVVIDLGEKRIDYEATKRLREELVKGNNE